MRFWRLASIVTVLVAGAMPVEARKSIAVVRERFANHTAIDLDFEAQSQMQKGDLAAAERTLTLALQADPTLWLTYFMRANLCDRRHKYQSVVEDCNRVLLTYPTFIPAAVLRASANSKLGHYEAAVKELDHVIRLRPDWQSFGMALNERAWIRA